MKPSEFLELRHWIQGEMLHMTSYGQVKGCCMLGAIEEALPSGKDSTFQCELRDLLLKDLGRYISITKWNDELANSKEQVILKLREVEEKLGEDFFS